MRISAALALIPGAGAANVAGQGAEDMRGRFF